MNEDIRKKLARKNGTLNELRKSEIIKKVKTKYPHLDDEVAILRKAMVILVDKVKQQHPNMDLSELEEYNRYVEVCKEDIKYENDR